MHMRNYAFMKYMEFYKCNNVPIAINRHIHVDVMISFVHTYIPKKHIRLITMYIVNDFQIVKGYPFKDCVDTTK